jgi:hypothetical protein
MLKLIPRRKKVPNALAVFGAFLLVASALGGAGQTLQGARQNDVAQHEAVGSRQEAGVTGEAEPAVAKTRKFRVNLFLFRH